MKFTRNLQIFEFFLEAFVRVFDEHKLFLQIGDATNGTVSLSLRLTCGICNKNQDFSRRKLGGDHSIKKVKRTFGGGKLMTKFFNFRLRYDQTTTVLVQGIHNSLQ